MKAEKEARDLQMKADREVREKLEQKQEERIEAEKIAREMLEQQMVAEKADREKLEQRHEERMDADRVAKEEFSRVQQERNEEQTRKQIENLARKQDVKLAEDREARQERTDKLNTKESKIKTFGELLKKVLYNIPQVISDVPMYFDAVDRIFTEYSVPDNIRISLLNPYLSSAARRFGGVCQAAFLYRIYKVRLLYDRSTVINETLATVVFH
jgi:hypothetical protein